MRLWNGWGNEDSDLTMELSDGLRALLEALVGPGTALSQQPAGDHGTSELCAKSLHVHKERFTGSDPKCCKCELQNCYIVFLHALGAYHPHRQICCCRQCTVKTYEYQL